MISQLQILLFLRLHISKSVKVNMHPNIYYLRAIVTGFYDLVYYMHNLGCH